MKVENHKFQMINKNNCKTVTMKIIKNSKVQKVQEFKGKIINQKLSFSNSQKALKNLHIYEKIFGKNFLQPSYEEVIINYFDRFWGHKSKFFLCQYS